jgi:hypothetical protein
MFVVGFARPRVEKIVLLVAYPSFIYTRHFCLSRNSVPRGIKRKPCFYWPFTTVLNLVPFAFRSPRTATDPVLYL